MSVRMPVRPEPDQAGCSICSAPTGDAALFCRTHSLRLASELRQVDAYLAEDLEITLTRQDRAGVQDGARAGGDRGLAWNERAADVIHDLNTTLNGWALEVSEFREDERDRLADVHGSDTRGLARWLVRNLTTLRRHPAAGTAYDELLRVVGRARHVIDLPTVSSSFYVGPCPQSDDEGAACVGEVWAYIATAADQPSWLRCTADDTHRWDSTRWLRAGRLIRARLHQLNRTLRRPAA